jgi:DNA-binding YbaB/EbfC family protein
MDPFDLGNIGALLGGFQQKVADMKDKAAKSRHTGEAAGGLVKITLTGDYAVDKVEIAEGAMEDRELLEDLVRAAMSEGLRKVREDIEKNMAELTGGLPIPPGMLPF